MVKLLNMVGFIVTLFVMGLYVTVGEPILIGVLTAIGVIQPGSTPYIIILGAPILILFAGVYILTLPDSQTRWGGTLLGR